MRLLLISGLVVSVISISGVARAQQSNGEALPAAQQPTATTQVRPASVINDIDVPYDVIMDVQTEYQGYAVTEARKASRGGQTVYQLRVDRDDNAGDYDSFYLMYDNAWKLLGRDAMVPPPKPKAEPQPAPAPATEQATARPTEGGRGAGTTSPNSGTGSAPTPQPAPQPTPEPEPTPQPTPQPEPSTGGTTGTQN